MEATRHLVTSADAQIVERCQKYVSMVFKFIQEMIVAWLERKNGLPERMGEVHDLTPQGLRDAKENADLAKLVEKPEVLQLYDEYKSLRTEMAEATRIFQCFQDDGCSKEMTEWEKEATTFVDCLVVAQVITNAENRSEEEQLKKLQKAKTVTEWLPASWAAVLQEEIEGIEGTAEAEG